MVLQLRGLAPSFNQFGTNRFVLYRCHCGDDYCGIISCKIERKHSAIHWIDVRYEDDDDSEEEAMFSKAISLLEFDLMAYDNVIARYIQNGKSGGTP